jgi:hypothetical protein
MLTEQEVFQFLFGRGYEVQAVRYEGADVVIKVPERDRPAIIIQLRNYGVTGAIEFEDLEPEPGDI